MGGKPQIPDMTERFMARVLRDEATGCWIWTVRLLPKGYGVFSLPGSERVYAHRWSYERFVEPIPEGLVIDHLCRNPPCVNPSHLEPVTNRENVKRGSQGSVTHCVHGHPLSGTNIYATKSGKRRCKTCNDDRYQRKHHVR